MPRLPVHSVDTAPEESREALKALEARTGKVLNIYGEMATSPAVVNAYVAMTQAIADHSILDAPTQQATPSPSATWTAASTARPPTPSPVVLPASTTT